MTVDGMMDRKLVFHGDMFSSDDSTLHVSFECHFVPFRSVEICSEPFR